MRKITSVLLALIMVFSTFLANGSLALAKEGPMWVYGEHNVAQIWCEECGWGYDVDCETLDECVSITEDLFCSICGFCSFFGNAECYLEHHCLTCGDCLDIGDGCGGCYDEYGETICDNCVETFDGPAGIAHCPECHLHYGYDTSDKCDCSWCDTEPHCEDCHEESCEYCGDCLVLSGHETYNLTNGGCAEHSVCYDCLSEHAGEDGIHCGGCYSCEVEVCSECGMCEDCAEWEEHCGECGYCFGKEGVRMCESGGDHCVQCCDDNGWICEQCGECTEGVGIEQCEDCGLCVDCCLDNSEAEGCTHGYCIFSSDYQDHLCPNCMQCPDDNECEYCGLCEDCQGDYHCEHEICPENFDEWEDHLCINCGECFDLDDLCEYCHMCENCWDHCEHGICPEDFDYYDHVCEQCGNCYEDHEFCEYCGLCINCCADNTEDMGCKHELCIESEEFAEHWCYEDNQCMDKCNHNDCEHPRQARLKGWQKNKSAHWQLCGLCGASVEKEIHTAGNPVIITEPDPVKRKNGTAKISCSVCGQDMGTISVPYVEIPANGSPYIINEPNDQTSKVSDITVVGVARYVTFSVQAGGENLSYQWYEVKNGLTPVALKDGGDWFSWCSDKPDVSGANTKKLTIVVNGDACNENYEYYCVVTNKNGSATTRRAKLDAQHVYGRIERDNAQTHSNYCVGDGCMEIKKTEKHVFGEWILVRAATETQTGLKQQKCEVCGYINKYNIPQVEPGHVHVYNQIKHNNTQHWYACKCGLLSTDERQDHTWGTPEVITPATEVKMGEQKLKCTVCGYSKTERIDKLPHTHEYWHDYSNPERGGRDVNGHYSFCKSGDGSIEKLPHDNFYWYIWVEATPGKEMSGIIERKCETCGFSEQKRYSYGTYPILVEFGEADYVAAAPGTTITVKYTQIEGRKWTASTYWDDLSDNPYYSDLHLKSVTLSPNKYSSTVTFKMPEGPVGLTVKGTSKCNHTGGTVYGEKVEPTCKAYGHEPDLLCKDCGEVVKAGERIEALGHDLPETPIAGTEVIEYCSVVTKYLNLINYVETEPNTATHGYSGDFICKRCKERVAGQKTPLVHGAYDKYNKANQTPRWVGHETYEKDAREATCVTDGYTGDTYCAYCDARIEKGKKVEKFGHLWSDWEVIRPATTKVKGMEQRICEWDNSHVETRITDYSGPDYSLKPDKTKVHFDFTYGETPEPVIVTYKSTGRDNISKIEWIDLDYYGNGSLYNVRMLDDFRAEISVKDPIMLITEDNEECMYVRKVPETNLEREDIAPYVQITANVKKTSEKYNIKVIGGVVKYGEYYKKQASEAMLNGGESLSIECDKARAKDFVRWEVIKDDSGLITSHMNEVGILEDNPVYLAMSPNDVIIRAVYKDDLFKVDLNVINSRSDIYVRGLTNVQMVRGKLDFTVSCDDTCLVYCLKEGADKYTRLEANKTAEDNTYSFSLDVNTNLTIYVFKKGDVTMDGLVNSADALQVLRYDVGKAKLNELQKLAADVSGDGLINSADALLILRYDVGKAEFGW